MDKDIRDLVTCESCGGNDADMPCAYPSENRPGCLRDKRLLLAAGDACIDFYMKTHVSAMREQTEPLKKLWSIGQELYLKKRNSHNILGNGG